jgi:hypothetical protein
MVVAAAIVGHLQGHSRIPPANTNIERDNIEINAKVID